MSDRALILAGWDTLAPEPLLERVPGWERHLSLRAPNPYDEDGYTDLDRQAHHRMNPNGYADGAVAGIDTTHHRPWSHSQRAGDDGESSED